ncbi:MAG TPA: POTRA domain-containing protein [Stellaceae bacterium]
MLGQSAVAALALGALTSLLCTPADAQPAVPGTAQPGRTPAPFQQIPAPLSRGAPVLVPSAPGPVAPPAGAANARFILRRIEFQGDTVYPQGDLQPLYARLIGQQVTVADVYGVAEAISAKYRNDGYLLSQALVPPQQIRDGIVRIRIVEGYVRRIVISGVPAGQSDLIRRIAGKITRDRPLRAATIERYLLLINDLAGVTATGALAPARAGIGAADLVVTVSQKTLDGELGFDNRASEYFGNYEAYAGFGVNSLLGEYERFSARFLASTTYQTHYTDLAFSLPVGTEGLKLQLRGLFGADHPGAALAPFELHDSSYLVSAGGDYPIIRSRLENWRVAASFDVREADSTSDALLTRQDDAIRALRVGTTYDRTDTLTGLSALNLVSVQLSQGLDFLGASDPGPTRTRTDGRPDFTKVNLFVSRDQPIAGPFSLALAGAAQLANGPLFFSEAFGVGGPQFGRAYDPSEILGDSGLAGSAELRFTGSGDGQLVRRYQLFGFVDGGAVYNNGALQPGLYRHAAETSTGFGARLSLTHGFVAAAELDFPLDRVVQATGDKDPRVFFSLAAQF